MLDQLCETEIRDGLVRFEIGDAAFLAEFIAAGEAGVPAANENKWRLSRYVYHSHRQGRRVKRARQLPRFKRVGYFDSLDECRGYLRERFDKNAGM